MAEVISNNIQRHLCEEVNKMKPKCKIISSVIDGTDSNDDIVEIFANKIESLYHGVSTDSTEMHNI